MSFAETPPAGRCQYAFLSRSFVTDCALAEAVVNAALWPEGKALLEDAAAWGVTIRVVPQASLPRDAGAVYQSGARQVLIGDRWYRLSTWMVSAIVVHELRHARQDQQGQLHGSCREVETPAYQATADYVRWLAGRMGGLPSIDEVRQHLSADDVRFFELLHQLVTTPGLHSLVAGLCGRPYRLW